MIETLKGGLAGPTGVTQVGTITWGSEGQVPILFGQTTGDPHTPFASKAVPLPTP